MDGAQARAPDGRRSRSETAMNGRCIETRQAGARREQCPSRSRTILMWRPPLLWPAMGLFAIPVPETLRGGSAH